MPSKGLGKARTGPRPSPSPATPFDGLGKVRTGSRTSPTMPCHALLRARQGSVGLSAPPNHALPCPLRGSAGFGLALQYPQIPKVVRRPFAGRGAWFCLRGDGGPQGGGPWGTTGYGLGIRQSTQRPGDHGGPGAAPGALGPGSRGPSPCILLRVAKRSVHTLPVAGLESCTPEACEIDQHCQGVDNNFAPAPTFATFPHGGKGAPKACSHKFP